ncbi:hypothetical protein NLG97_g6219 [Lecanicillium saksenae]|uniref:Uncharacterized protein n=1 Tax=Lecanicillium saksenae TaxID=468837 RepID=A0ACC1QSM7_9HYPO|nr:hypothetical protein NLG97_g6219 [Lecanicillium saksenae]
MPRQAEDKNLQSSAQKPPEHHRTPVSRLKVGEILQPVKLHNSECETSVSTSPSQDLYLFQDNVAGRSALVHDSNPGESHDDDGHKKRATTKSPGQASQGRHKSPSSGESHHIKIYQRRRSEASPEGAGSAAHRQHFHVSVATTNDSGHIGHHAYLAPSSI